jgi:hypothetical protein
LIETKNVFEWPKPKEWYVHYLSTILNSTIVGAKHFKTITWSFTHQKIMRVVLSLD